MAPLIYVPVATCADVAARTAAIIKVAVVEFCSPFTNHFITKRGQSEVDFPTSAFLFWYLNKSISQPSVHVNLINSSLRCFKFRNKVLMSAVVIRGHNCTVKLDRLCASRVRRS